MEAMQSVMNQNRVWYCLECGKCSAVCPITRWEKRQYTSPRLLVEKAVQGHLQEVQDDPLFWMCLTCKRCSELCPSGVYFSEFLRDARAMAREKGQKGECSHSDVVQVWGRIMAHSNPAQERLGWINKDLQISDDSDVLYFVGCLPYYDALFREIGCEGIEIARAAVRILNHLGIQPQVMADERCCGHDQLWEGDWETFQALAKLNLEQIQATGAQQIVTTCPECARTLKLDYPRFVGDHRLRVFHLTEFLAQPGIGEALDLRIEDLQPAATYQDPCRLGRHLGVYDAPRELMARLGFNLIEMERAGKASLCCGTSCWTQCGQVSKNIQVERLREAKATGAEYLVTACVKCQIHFKCAQSDPALTEELDIEVRDLTTLLAERLGGYGADAEAR